MKIKTEINFGFWKKVRARAKKEGVDGKPRPIFVLAPMANVTDPAFRRIIAKYSRMGKRGGGPDVLWSEFVSADGLCSPGGRDILLRDLEFSKGEHPIVAQLFTSHPEKIRHAVALCAKLGFDGIDINMGCPDRSVEKQNAGAAMMKNPEMARAIIESARAGAIDAISATKNNKKILPISVKTRIGYNKNEIDTWLRFLLGLQLPVLTVHLRTRREMSDVPAHWELIPEIIRLRDEIQSDLPASERTIIIGNGDVKNLADARAKVEATAKGELSALEKSSPIDGVMLGRAIFGNPWLFDQERNDTKNPVAPSIAERLAVLVEHTLLFEKLLGDVKNFAIMKKHFKAYVSGWDGAKELRVKLMATNSASEVKTIVKTYLMRYT